MFGDNFILGTVSMAIDSKGRVKINRFTGASKDEGLVIMKRDGYVEIFKKEKVINKLKVLKDKLNHVTDISLYNKYDEEINSILASIDSYGVSVDKEGRINLGVDLSSEYNFSGEVYLEGIMDGVRIWNKEEFLQYQKSNIKKNVVR